MSKNRVQFNTIVSSQLPAYVQEDFPLISDFLKQYYLGQEYQGGPIDLIQNIDEYIKLDNTTNLVESVVLDDDITFYATTINVDPVKYPAGTKGFTDSFGLLKIDSEVITYTGKTDYSFTGCKRGFVGITSIRDSINKEELVFESTEADDHTGGVNIENLSCLFLKEFLLKTKHQLLPGLENRNLTPELNQDIFVKQSKDFYLTSGIMTTPLSRRISSAPAVTGPFAASIITFVSMRAAFSRLITPSCAAGIRISQAFSRTVDPFSTYVAPSNPLTPPVAMMWARTASTSIPSSLVNAPSRSMIPVIRQLSSS